MTKRPYFEGWYYKLVSADTNQAYAFIPGVSLTEHHAQAFIQLINGVSGESHYFQYHIEQFEWGKNNFLIKIGNSIFARDFIDLNICGEKIDIKGRIHFTNSIRYPQSVFSPGIMGWYSFVPFMQCKHAVISVTHTLNGFLSFNGSAIDFTGGRGYIEKDWGKSFPKDWLWIQCNTFFRRETSFFLSIADIPWLGSHFQGLISFLYIPDRFYLFNTYTQSYFANLKREGQGVSVDLINKDYLLRVQVKQKTTGHLTAPLNGNMERPIKESIDSEVQIQLYEKNGSLLFEDSGIRAGVEFTEGIFNGSSPEQTVEKKSV